MIMNKRYSVKGKLRHRFLLFGIIPVATLLVIMLVVSFVYNLYWEDNLEKNYEQSLRNCSDEIDNLFDETLKTVPLLTFSSEIKDFLYTPTYFQQEDQYKATPIKRSGSFCA